MTAVPRDTALRFASVEDFLAHTFPDDLPHELVDGVVVAHAAPTEEHGHILANLVSAIHRALDEARSPCHVEAGSGVRPRRRTKATLRVPDAVVRCPQDANGNAPVAVIEILSASNSAADMDEKTRDYKSLPSIRQIVHIAQDRPAVSFQRRAGDLWIAEELEGRDAVLRLDGLSVDVPLSIIYDRVPLAE
jgi:Uma2 family endonuclease